MIIGIHGGNHRPIDLGAGKFDTFRTKDVFVTALSHDLKALRWVKYMPMILNGTHNSMGIDRRGRITMSGIYDGSMQIDNRLLIHNIPEQQGYPNTFFATFAMPSPEADMAPPTMDHVPSSMVVEATSPEGAKVFFMPPTVIDDGNAGATVSCVPAPSTVFPIGPTLVKCTASDPFGKQSLETFTVDVVDTTGPSFAGATPITVEATGPAGAIVSFETPTAVDLVDGPRPVTCSHSSGTMFPIGTTVVQCSSSDTKGHQTQTAFRVTVFTWSGVLSPINADGTSSFKLGSTITVKFQLTGASSSITNAAATLSLVKLSPDPTGTVIEATSPGNHNTGNGFRYNASSGQYIYNLSTKPLSAGTWSLRIDPGDGVPRAVTISLYE